MLHVTLLTDHAPWRHIAVHFNASSKLKTNWKQNYYYYSHWIQINFSVLIQNLRCTLVYINTNLKYQEHTSMLLHSSIGKQILSQIYIHFADLTSNANPKGKFNIFHRYFPDLNPDQPRPWHGEHFLTPLWTITEIHIYTLKLQNMGMRLMPLPGSTPKLLGKIR